MFNVSYVTTLPKIGNAPTVTINGYPNDKFIIKFINADNGNILKTIETTGNNSVSSNLRQWYTNWCIIIEDITGKIKFVDIFNPKNKVVFIKFDSKALGDTIAWIPYVEEFRKKYSATIICSTFFNQLLIKNYPNILFVKPNTVIDNIYAQYYVGASYETNQIYAPYKTDEIPLQKVARDILGLDNLNEFKPNLTTNIKPFKLDNEKYVTLSEFASSPIKEWKYDNGWQEIVDFINQELNYKVIVISKEKTNLNNIIDLTGDIPLEERLPIIFGSEFFMGVSSGLSWLAWALNKPVIMISDYTKSWHEFSCFRLYNQNITHPDEVKKIIKLNFKSLF